MSTRRIKSIGYVKLENNAIINFEKYKITDKLLKIQNCSTFNPILKADIKDYPIMIIPLRRILYIKLKNNENTTEEITTTINTEKVIKDNTDDENYSDVPIKCAIPNIVMPTFRENKKEVKQSNGGFSWGNSNNLKELKKEESNNNGGFCFGNNDNKKEVKKERNRFPLTFEEDDLLYGPFKDINEYQPWCRIEGVSENICDEHDAQYGIYRNFNWWHEYEKSLKYGNPIGITKPTEYNGKLDYISSDSSDDND